MATVYSLVCFGGLSGKTVTFTDTGDVVNLTTHGLRQGVTGIIFSTTGALPTGITAGTTYWPRDGADANKFTIYPTTADALAGTNQLTFSGTGSGTHTVKSAYLLGLTAGELSRYGSSGSERVYTGLAGATTVRASVALGVDDEIIEICDAFTETVTGQVIFNIGSGNSVTYTSTVSGQRTDAFHRGKPGSGYILLSTNAAGCGYLGSYYVTIDGLEFNRLSATSSSAYFVISVSTFGSVFKNNIVRQSGTGETTGLNIGTGVYVYGNIIMEVPGPYGGIYPSNSLSGAIIAHNLVTKCGVGFKAFGNGAALVYNNLSVGNTVNWSNSTLYIASRFRGNMGTIADRVDFAATVGTTNLVCVSALPVTVNQPVMLETTGTLPSIGGVPLFTDRPYFIKSISGNTITLTTAYNGGVLGVFSDGGSGTHAVSLVWANVEPVSDYIDDTDMDLVFTDWTNNDFSISGSGGTPASEALMVNRAVEIPRFIVDRDIIDVTRPNYEPSTYPNNLSDVGPFEFDHGNGDIPQTITVSNLATGSIIKISRVDTGAILDTATESAGTATLTAGYSGAVTIEARCASSAPYYRPWVTQITLPDTTSVTALQELD